MNFKVKRRSDEFLVFLYNYVLSTTRRVNRLNLKSQVNCISTSHFGIGSMQLYVQAEKNIYLTNAVK